MLLAFFSVTIVALLAAMVFSLLLNWRYWQTLETERAQYRQAFYLQAGLSRELVKSFEPREKKKITEPTHDLEPTATFTDAWRATWTALDEQAFTAWRESRFFSPVDDATALLEWQKVYGQTAPLEAFRVQ